MLLAVDRHQAMLSIQYDTVDGCLPNRLPIFSTLSPWASSSVSESLSIVCDLLTS